MVGGLPSKAKQSKAKRTAFWGPGRSRFFSLLSKIVGAGADCLPSHNIIIGKRDDGIPTVGVTSPPCLLLLPLLLVLGCGDCGGGSRVEEGLGGGGGSGSTVVGAPLLGMARRREKFRGVDNPE